MWIIRLALNRPYTFVVAALLLLLVTPFVLLRTPTDVLPSINIPVVSIIWNFNGLSAKDIEQRMVYTEERVLTTTVNDIQHIESTSYDGIGIIKVFFQPTVTISTELGQKQYQVDINTFPLRIDSLNELPIKTIDGATIRVRDVAQVRDGYDPQTNIVRQDGVRSVLMVLLKNGSASTLSVVAGAKQAMANVLNTVNGAVRVKEFSDQSVFVRAAISGVVREGVIAGALTALMILLFLGSWRSTIVVAISIPLSVLASLAVLGALRDTINLMTLGGLALAVGILVDDATVTIENIERHLGLGEKLEDAILKGAGEIALPALVSTF